MRRIISLIVVAALVHGVALVIGLAGAVGAEGSSSSGDMSRKAADSRKLIANAKGMLVRGFAVLQDARASGDNGRVQCVNSSLTQMKGLMRLADSSLLELEEAQSSGRKSTVERNAVKIKVATGKVSAANRKLKACMGKHESGVLSSGGAVILVEPDPDLPNVDPTEGLKDLSTTLENTTSASPFFK